MDIVSTIQRGVVQAVQSLYGATISEDQITMNVTRKEFEGDYTVVVFPFTRTAKKKPEAIGEEMGQYLQDNLPLISGYNVIKGFLNLSVSNDYWTQFLNEIYTDDSYGRRAEKKRKVMVEFSSPNTNKPLHLGHIRNILLGWSAYKILDAAGCQVVRVQIVNDRGIAICKSMLAWHKYSNNETPETAGLKSDHFVGHYYVLFEQKFRQEYQQWQQSEEGQRLFEEKRKDGQSQEAFFKAFKNSYFNEYSTLGDQAKTMLRQWEAGDPETVALWKRMNNWVYEGFDQTYNRLGVEFDKIYYESDTYLLGRDIVRRGLEEGVFYQEEDGSVWINLEDAKLDKKLVLRSDGTSVYMTQDLGTARLRYEDFGVDSMVYVVADEQNYHFQVLFEILKRLGEPYSDGLYHLSYGMVDLPGGRMKSREGTVVDADDLIAEVTEEARKNARERGTLAELNEKEQETVIRQVGLAALKFFIIKVQPKKRMTFNPKESVDMQGQTGPYVQNAYVRIRSVLRKAGETYRKSAPEEHQALITAEKDLVAQLHSFPEVIQTAAEELDPSAVANYCYDLAKNYHRFYHDHSILRAETEAAKVFRLKLSQAVANTLKTGMDLLGIDMPERM